MNAPITDTDTDRNDTVKAGNAKAFLVADALYLLLIFGWTLLLTPLGRDFAFLARPDLPGPVSGRLFSMMTGLFGGHAWMYFLINLLLLYGCMTLLLGLTRMLGKGPWWLGSIAAVLFMANPVKTEAVLSLGGLRYLLPGLLGLTVLVVYVWCRSRNGWLFRLLPLPVYVVAILAFPDGIPMFLVLAVLERCFFSKGPERRRRLWPIVGVGLVAFLVSGQWAVDGAWQPARIFVPLYLVLYPIGMLPDTVALFEAWPVLGWGCGLGLTALAVWLMRKAQNPVFTFGLLGAAAFRLLQGAHDVDPVTLAGGGNLLIPITFVSLAAAGGFQALLHHPQWRVSVVRLSTLLCVVAMVCQGWANWHWLQGGRAVRRFQQAAVETVARHPAQPVAVAPDIHYIGTVPVLYAQSVFYDTPFSEALPVVALMPLSLLSSGEVDVTHYSSEKLTVSVQGHATALAAKPPFFSRAWWQQRNRPPEPVTLEIKSCARPFPSVRIPCE